MTKLFHATNKDAAASMLEHGINLNHERKADPGDFGRGFYLTADIHRAKAIGTTILVVEIDDSEYAYIPNPYYPDESEAGKLFRSIAFNQKDDMLTCVNGIGRDARLKICATIQEEFLKRGWKGIKTDHKCGEYVVFDLSTIKSPVFGVQHANV